MGPPAAGSSPVPLGASPAPPNRLAGGCYVLLRRFFDLVVPVERLCRLATQAFGIDGKQCAGCLLELIPDFIDGAHSDQGIAAQQRMIEDRQR